MREHWGLDPSVVFLNHGSFGACPKEVLKRQHELRAHMEREPVQFFIHELPARIDDARRDVAAFVGARPENLGFVRNATAGVNAVLRSLELRPGDELLTTDHVYNACANALDFVARRAGAKVVTVALPFPLRDMSTVTERIVAGATSKTRLALIDHITSPTGLVLPIAEIVQALADRGIDTLVDGAHGPGMVKLELEKLGAAYYTGNFHKWTCAPKGAAMLWVREDRQADLHPSVISHGYNSPRDRARWLEEIDWTGTDDPTSWLCVPTALRFVGGLVSGGWSEVRRRNRELVLTARDALCAALEIDAPAPDAMIGSLVAVPLPAGQEVGVTSALYADPLQQALFDRHRIEVPVPPWPHPPSRLLRVSAHLYNHADEYDRLGAALRTLLR